MRDRRRLATTGYRRIVIVGVAGAGKSTVALRIGRASGLPVIERDALGALGSPEYRAEVTRVVRTESWIFDGFPYYVDDEVYQAADLVVALDYRKSRVMLRVLWRSIALALGATRGAHTPQTLHSWTDPDHPIQIAWKRHAARRTEIAELPARKGVPVLVRLRSPRDADRWLARTWPDPASRRTT